MQIFLGEDDGAVSIWSRIENDAWNLWNKDLSVAEHDGAVMSVDCLVPNKEYITAGADGNIKVFFNFILVFYLHQKKKKNICTKMYLFDVM